MTSRHMDQSFSLLRTVLFALLAAAGASSAEVVMSAICDDSSTGGSFIQSAAMQLDGGTWMPMLATDGLFSDEVVESVYRNLGLLSSGQHVATVKCTDTANNTGPIAYLYFNVVGADVLGPVILWMNHTDLARLTFENVVENGFATDLYTGNHNIAGCKMRLNEGAWYDVAATDGNYDSPSEGFDSDLGQLPAGLHTVYAYCTDELGNNGTVHTDTLNLLPADVMLAIERTGSMNDLIMYVTQDNSVNTRETEFTLVKTLTLNQAPTLANVTVKLRSETQGCTVYFETRVQSQLDSYDVITQGFTDSGISVDITDEVSTLSQYSAPIEFELYLKAGPDCTAYNNNFRVSQEPTKIRATKDASKSFVDLVSETTQVGMVSYATSASTDHLLTIMSNPANKDSVKNSIEAISPSLGNICLACAIDNGVNELMSARGRYPNANRAIILMTDGPGNVGNAMASATNARNNGVIIYTIGFGNSADEVELTNIALLTNGEYYYAPDAQTLLYIYLHIGE